MLSSPLRIHEGYFQVTAEPVSTCVHEIFALLWQIPRLVTKLNTPPLPSASPETSSAQSSILFRHGHGRPVQPQLHAIDFHHEREPVHPSK